MNNKSKRETSRNRQARNKFSLGAIKEDIKKNGLMKGEKVGKKLIDSIGKVTFAVFFISFLISAVVILTGQPPYPPTNIYDMLDIDTAEFNQILPSDKSVFDYNKPVPEELARIILSDNTKVYKSDSLRFIMSENKIEKEDLTELSEKVKNARETEAESGDDETTVYYLVLFDDYRKVNFSLSETVLEIYGKKYLL